MGGETIAILVSVCGFLLTFGGVFVALGKRDARLEALEKAFDKEQTKNSDQHKEFYATRDKVTDIAAQFTDFGRRLGTIEDDVKEILRRLPRGDD